MKKYKYNFQINTDGGSRGNPGPAALGVIIKGEGIQKEYGEYIGEGTNNEAEYGAVIFALKKLRQLVGKNKAKESHVDFFVDSEFLVEQMNGNYKIKESTIQHLFLKVWNDKIDFGEVVFTHIPREKNKEADKIVNAVLDREANKLL